MDRVRGVQLSPKLSASKTPKLSASKTPKLSPISYNELRIIGTKIFSNELNEDKEKLVFWNGHEDFASMGIGHWTWYPANRRPVFGNTFPQLLTYMESHNVILPKWLVEAKETGAPWKNKEELSQASNTPQVKQLKRILFETRDLQAKFILRRIEQAIPRIVKATPSNQQVHVVHNLNTLLKTSGLGIYSIMDYITFKGEGLRMNGGYRGQNWGVLQVLIEMKPAQQGEQALNSFADAAIRVLERRIKNSPKSRNESRWLPGWIKRINTYRK